MDYPQDKAIVVTGGAGFIGSGIIRYLNDQGRDHLIVVDRLRSTEKWKNLVGKRFRHFLEADELFSWLEGKEKEIAAFIHLGACSDTMEKDASYLLKNNYHYTVQLAQYAIQHNHRFIYASSAATYGDGNRGFSDDHTQIDALEPLNMYGYSKQLFDQWCLRHGVMDRVVGLKYFNVFGPNEEHKGRMASAVQKMFPPALKGETIALFQSSDPQRFGDGEQERDFLYVKDCARMTCAFLENTASGIFNIGSGTPSTWNQLAHSLFSAVDSPTHIEYVPMPTELLGKYQNYTCADMKKTRSLLGNLAQAMPLKEAVADYVQTHLIPQKRW